MADPSSPKPPARALDRSSLERVLARAAELQSTTGETGEEFTEEQLLELGREVGLSPQNLRQALAEERTRSVVPDEERGFDGKEAVSLHRLLDTLSLYCAESVVWWDEGEGTPSGARPSTMPEKPKIDGKEKPVKVVQPEAAPKPTYKVPAEHVVARAWF